MLRAFWLVALPALLQGGTDPEDFRKYFPKLGKTADQVEAVHALAQVKGLVAAEVLLPLLKHDSSDVRAAAVKVLADNDDTDAVAFLVAALKKKDSQLRAGLCQVLGLGRRAVARPELEKLVREGDWLARARACEALGRLADPSSVPVIVPCAKDSEVEVRIAACDALGALADETGAPALLAALGDKEWRVRASAIAALARVRTKEAVPALVKIVAGDEGRLVEDAERTLKALTGRDFGRDGEAWKRWWGSVEAAYQLPTVAELEKAAAKREQAARSGGTGVRPDRKITEFLGVQTPSKRVMFIIDISGSMEDLVVERDRYRDRGYPGFRKIDVVKEELARTIERLDPSTEFAVVTFATAVRPWKKGALIRANPVNRQAAIDFARGLEPLGGSSREELASAGLGGAAALGEGKTNTFSALMFGLYGTDEPVRGTLERNAGRDVDTIFFLSDGKPSHGELVDTDDIQDAVRAANQQKKITLHVLAIGEFEKHFMRDLAEQNGGVFVDLGK